MKFRVNLLNKYNNDQVKLIPACYNKKVGFLYDLVLTHQLAQPSSLFETITFPKFLKPCFSAISEANFSPFGI